MSWVSRIRCAVIAVLAAFLCNAPSADAGFAPITPAATAAYALSGEEGPVSADSSGLSISGQPGAVTPAVDVPTGTDVWIHADAPHNPPLNGPILHPPFGHLGDLLRGGDGVKGLGRENDSVYLLCWEDKFARRSDRCAQDMAAEVQAAAASEPLLIPLPPAAFSGLIGLAGLAGVGVVRRVRRSLRNLA